MIKSKTKCSLYFVTFTGTEGKEYFEELAKTDATNLAYDGNGTKENRIKLIRNESIGNFAWDTNNLSDWSKSTITNESKS